MAGCALIGGDSLDHVPGDRQIKLAAGEVIEEEQRLGALHQHVIHAHRHQVDADRAVPSQREGELQLGADAVGARDQHRLAVFLRDCAQRAKAADAAEHFGPQGAPRERLDRLDEGVARVDIDAGIAIGKRFAHARVSRLQRDST